MGAKKIVLGMLTGLLLSSVVLADRALDDSEILSIFQVLTKMAITHNWKVNSVIKYLDTVVEELERVKAV